MTPEEFARRRRSLSDQVVRTLVLMFTGLGSWYDRDRDRFVEQAIPQLRGGQTALSSLTSAWVVQQLGRALDLTLAPPGIPESSIFNLRNGVDDFEVYARPFTAIYTALSKGLSLDAAVNAGSTRLSEIAEMDLQSTYAHASRAAMEELPEDAKPRFWRRVLIGSENCAMCVLASTQRYRVENLNPIHPGCDCEVRALPGREDPGQVIDEALLDKVHTAVEDLTGVKDLGGRAVNYKHLVTQITADHGELGELLVRPNDRFTSLEDLTK